MEKVKIKGVDICYETSGSGEPILFIHGAYFSGDEWVYQQAFFSRKYQTVLVDMPGHGGSDRLPAYSVEGMADYLAAFIERKKLSPCIVCGHSLGGMAAQALVAARPELVSKLILAETSYGVKSNPVEAFFTALSMPLLKRVSVEKQAVMYAAQLGRYSDESKAYCCRAIASHANGHDNYNRIWDATVSFAGKERLRTIACPTLIIVGEKNRQTHHQAKVMKSQIPHSELEYIKKAGHMVNIDAPEDFNKCVLRFIKTPG